MESSIDKHLVCPRTIQRNMEEGYAPPYPAWAARADTSVTQVVMGYFGIQFKSHELHGKACMALDKILRSFSVASGPGHYDIARFKDAQGFENMVAIAYWKDPAQFSEWQDIPDVHNWWNSDDRLDDGIGYFREIIKPDTAHFETIFSSSEILEGVGVVMGRVSDEIQEHGYWGGMRDRIPLAQTDKLSAVGALAISNDATASGKRVRIAGHENLTVIRSGQDWIDTLGKERELYINEMEPTLRRGMDFLHTQGRDIGCYTNRYMQHIDGSGQKTDKTFGLSYWRSLSNLEEWSKSHPTHVAIFGTFMRIVQEMEFQLQLRLYHEVSVLKADEQEYEYMNCHPQTGLLNGLI